MKNLFSFALLFTMLPLFLSLQAQDEDLLYIEWFGEDEVANELVSLGMGHMMNIEREKALTYFQAAVEKDPTLFAPHVPLTWMTKGDQKAYHKVQAQRLVAGKNEPSRMYVSLLDLPSGKEGAATWRSTWKKMHEVAPDGQYIHFQYALSLEDPQARIDELNHLAMKVEKDNRNTGHIHNILGYTHYAQGDKEKAKAHFEKYLEVRPDGYNAYDSMGEYYHNEDDLKKALKYYQKALDHYPHAVSATNAIEDIEAQMDERGNLLLITTEYIDPSHMNDYLAWGKGYKAVADKTNFHDFYVSSSDGAFHYTSIVGKTLADVEAYDKEWEEWASQNDELQVLYEKYKHTVTSTERSLWRHSAQLSYAPEGYAQSEQPTYARAYRATIKFGHEAGAKEVLESFKKEWTDGQISFPYSVYWNVFGEKGPCVVIYSAYSQIADWTAEHKEVGEKIGKEKLDELMKAWLAHISEWEELERFPNPELSHINGTALAAND